MFREHLPQIEEILARVARRFCWIDAEAEDFASWARLRLIQNDYRVLRRFQGKSQLATYLTTVITNLARDYRIAKWGKWRPSEAAKRLGEIGLQLEILLHRDRRSFSEAVEILRQHYDIGLSHTQLAEMAGELPQRAPRRFEDDSMLEFVPAQGVDAERSVRAAEREALLDRGREALERLFLELSVEDRLLLKMRFQDGLQVATIARLLSLEQRPLYGRIQRLLGRLRHQLEADGFDAEALLEAFGWNGAEAPLDYGVPDSRPPSTGESGTGEAVS